MKLHRPGYLFLLILAIAFAQNSGGQFPYLVFYLSATTLLASAAWAWILGRGLKVRVDTAIRERQVGDKFAARIELVNATPLPAAWVALRDHTGHVDGNPTEVHCALWPFAKRTVTRLVSCDRRGHYRLGPVDVIVSDPLGLFTVHRRFGEAKPFVVYPRPLFVRDLVFAPKQQLSRSPAVWRAERDPASLANVRPLAPGDPLRHVHWKVSARRGALHVKEFESRASSSLLILLDLSRAAQFGTGAQRSDELAVSVALGLSLGAVREGRGVGLLASSAQPLRVPIGYGLRHYFRLREHLVDADADGERSLLDWVQGVSSYLVRGSSLVIISPELQSQTVDLLAHLRRDGFDVAMVHVLPEATHRQQSEQERARLIRILARVGTVYVPLHAGQEQIEGRPLARCPAGRAAQPVGSIG